MPADQVSTLSAPSPLIPPLENGDSLSRDEFERRYHAMPHVKKAELIEGVVYMASPVRYDYHGLPHFRLISWMSLYTMVTPSLLGADNTTVRLDVINEPQPDVLLMIEPACGGQARLNNGYIEHAPELVAEISASSVSIDLNDKFEAYRRTGVREYIVWRVLDEVLDWFLLRDERFVPLVPDAEGILKSEVFPGLWLDPAALLRGDTARLLEVSRQGTSSAEHAAFVAKLAHP